MEPKRDYVIDLTVPEEDDWLQKLREQDRKDAIKKAAQQPVKAKPRSKRKRAAK